MDVPAVDRQPRNHLVHQIQLVRLDIILVAPILVVAVVEGRPAAQSRRDAAVSGNLFSLRGEFVELHGRRKRAPGRNGNPPGIVVLQGGRRRLGTERQARPGYQGR